MDEDDKVFMMRMRCLLDEDDKVFMMRLVGVL